MAWKAIMKVSKEAAVDVIYSLPGLGDLHEIYTFSHFLHSSCPNFYRNVLKIQKCVTCNQARSIFGFKGEDNIGLGPSIL